MAEGDSEAAEPSPSSGIRSGLPPPGPPETLASPGVGSLVVEGGSAVYIGDQRFEVAPIGRRLTARVLDLVAIAVGSGIGAAIAAPMAAGDRDLDSSTYGLGLGLSFVFLFMLFLAASVFVNEFWLVAKSGRSLGKRATNIQVVKTDTGRPPGWARSLSRGALPFGILLFPPIFVYVLLMLYVDPRFWWVVITVLVLMPYVPMMWDPTRRGLHDRMAGTIVVRAT